MKEFVIIFACAYSFVKEPFRRFEPKSGLFKLPWRIIITSLACLILTLIGIFLTPFIFFKFFVYLHLQMKHGDSFGGFLNTLDSHFVITDNVCFMHTALVIEENDDITSFLETLKRSVKTMHDSIYQLGSSVNCTFGYIYYVKNRVKAEEVFSEVVLNNQRTVTKGEIVEYTNCLAPKTKLWSVSFFKQPLLDQGNQSKKLYVVLFSMNHCVVDGYNFILLIQNYFYNKELLGLEISQYSIPPREKMSIDDYYLTDRREITLELPGYPNQRSVIFSEENLGYSEKIKKIRKKLNVGYTDVLVAVFLKAFSTFLAKKRSKPLDQIQIVVSHRLDINDISNMLNGGIIMPKIGNKVLFQTFPSPIIGKYSPMDDLLLKVSENYRYASRSLDSMLLHLSIKYILTFLPLNFYKKGLTNRLHNTLMVVTNLGNQREGNLLGRKIVKMFNLASFMGDGGMFVVFLTHHGKLQISFMSKEACVENQDDGENILKMALENIDLMAEDL